MRAVFLLLAFVLTALQTVSAQQITDIDKILQKPMTASGTQTLESLTNELTNQSGFTIASAKQIKARKLTVAFESVPLKTILDSLAALYGWTWKRESDTVIRLQRAPLPEISQLSNLPKAFVAILPVDLRALLLADKDFKQNIEDALTKRPDFADPGIPDIQKRMGLLPKRIFPFLKQHYHQIVDPIAGMVAEETTFPYDKLTADQKQATLAYVVFQALRSLPPALLFDMLASYQKTGEEAILELKDGGVMIGSYEQQGAIQLYSGFGKSIP